MQHPPPTVTTRSRPAQPLLMLFVAVAAILVGTTTVASAKTASQHSSPSRFTITPASETRVGVAAISTHEPVGSLTAHGPVFIGRIGCNYDRTMVGSCVATNTPKPGLGADFDSALEEIDSGAARPNVRNPKPFANDGRGGTTQLPTTDSGGNPVTYTEHTVNPRLPGGKLDGSRIITGSDGSVWATKNHFTSWTKIR